MQELEFINSCHSSGILLRMIYTYCKVKYWSDKHAKKAFTVQILYKGVEDAL